MEKTRVKAHINWWGSNKECMHEAIAVLKKMAKHEAALNPLVAGLVVAQSHWGHM